MTSVAEQYNNYFIFKSLNARSIVIKVRDLEHPILAHNPHDVAIRETQLRPDIADHELIPSPTRYCVEKEVSEEVGLRSLLKVIS